LAGKVTAGLAESNGSLPPGGWLKVTCGLTACTPGSVPGPTLGIDYGRTLPFLPSRYVQSSYTDLSRSNKTHKEAWLCSRDLFLHAQLWTWKKFRHGTPLTDINNAVDGGPMFLTPWTVDAKQGLRLKLHQFDLSLYLLQTWL